MIRIFVDSASDYTMDDLTAHGLELFPICITIGEESYQDGVNLKRDQLYEKLAAGCAFPTTSQPSIQLFLDAFELAKEQGDELIYLALSSALSGTYQSACTAKDMVGYAGVHIIDTLSATYTIKIMADHAAALRKEGRSATEIVAEIEALKSRVKVIAVPDSLEYLCKGGRVSRATATIGTLANIKPIITVTTDGNNYISNLQKLIFALKEFDTLVQLLFDVCQGSVHCLLRHNVVGRREDDHML